MIHYIHSIKDLEVIISIKDMTRLISFINVSYAVYSNMRSYTDGTILFSTGVFTSESKKQKLNTKNSTESELVSISNVLLIDLHLIIS